MQYLRQLLVYSYLKYNLMGCYLVGDAITKKNKYLINNVDAASKEYITFWINSIFLSWQWWLCTIVILGTWILWVNN